MDSIWKETVQMPRTGGLSGNRRVQVAVIGGGMAGILTAYYLQKKGKQVVVLEADRVGGGQTAGTTAKVTSQHGLFYHKLIQDVGEDRARQYARANQTAIGEYRQLVKKLSIQCHWEERPAYIYSVSQSEPLRREACSAARLGLPASFVQETGLPFPVCGAVRLEGQAQFHPLEFLKAVASQLAVFERTRAISVKGGQVHTNRGTVLADQVVFACHYPFVNIPGFYFARMYQERSYVVALDGAGQVDGMYLGIDGPGYSFRNWGDLLLLGGGGHRTGKYPGKNPYRKLEEAANHFWPGAKVAARWSAQDCVTLDKIPYIGRFGASTSNWYVATGFKKWGMTTSMVSAMVLSDLVLGEESLYGQVFSPQRFYWKASAKSLASHMAESAKGLSMGLVPGGARCPHMGCRLQWNPAEKTWDCPCHGSRFGQNGQLANNPAQDNIPFID